MASATLTEQLVVIQLKSTTLRVARTSANQPVSFKQLMGPTFSSANCVVRSDSDLLPGIPRDPYAAVLAGAVECSDIEPPSNLLEVSKSLNDLAGLRIDRLDTYIYECHCDPKDENGEDIAVVPSEMGEEPAVPPFSLYGDHGYALCPTLEETNDAASEATSQIVEPIGDLMLCTICGDKFYDPVYLNIHTLFQHQKGQNFAPATSTSTATKIEPINHNHSNQENMESAENLYASARSKKVRKVKQEYHQEHQYQPQYQPQYQQEEVDTKPAPTATYDCFVRNCHEQFVEELDLRDHIQGVHGRDKGKYRCLHCDNILKTPSVFYEHYRIHDEAKLYSCLYCGKRFWQERSMRVHRC